MNQCAVGLDIGGTKCSVVLGQAQFPKEASDAFVLDRISFDTRPKRGPEAIIQQMCSSIECLLNKNQFELSAVESIGISCGGPLDAKNGVIQHPPNLYGWHNIPIAKLLTERFGVPVFLQNDANACALAEWKLGAAKGFKHVAFLTFGTGLGAGFILDNRLYSGASGMAGEVGHIRLHGNGPVGYGKSGSFEGFCSGGGIAQIARSKVIEQLQMGRSPNICPSIEQLGELNAKNVATAAEAGDELALEIYRISGRHLGYGLAILIDMLNPEIIVIGSIYARNSELLWPSAEAVLREEAVDLSLGVCRVVPAQLGDRLGDYAALSVALQGKEAICTEF